VHGWDRWGVRRPVGRGAPERPLSQEQLARLLGLSWSTVARWETGGELGAQMEQKLLRLRRALELLGEMVTPEYRVPFFEQRRPLLLKFRPIDCWRPRRAPGPSTGGSRAPRRARLGKNHCDRGAEARCRLEVPVGAGGDEISL